MFGHSVTTNFFSTLGAVPVVGRLFAEGDGFQGTGDSAVPVSDSGRGGLVAIPRSSGGQSG